jgi:hypothetical protein
VLTSYQIQQGYFARCRSFQISGLDQSRADEVELMLQPFVDRWLTKSLLEEMKKDLMQHPYVRSVNIQAKLDGQVSLVFDLRHAQSILVLDDEHYILDEQGAIMMRDDLREHHVSIVLSGFEKENLFKKTSLLRSLSAFIQSIESSVDKKFKISQIHRDVDDVFTIWFDSGLSVRVRVNDLPHLQEKIQTIFLRLSERAELIESLFLDGEDDNRLVVRFRTNAES